MPAILHVAAAPGGMSTATAARYSPIAGFGIFYTSLTGPEFPVGKAGTFSGLQVYATANTSTSTDTFSMLFGGSAGSPAVAIGPGATGRFTDTTNTQTITADTAVSHQAPAVASGAVTVRSITCLFSATDGSSFTHMAAMSADSSTSVTSTSRVYALQGHLNTSNVTTADENRAQFRVAGAATFRNIGAQITANARTGTCTLRSRVDGVDGAQAASIGAGATGSFRDTTNTDTLTAGAEINVTIDFSADANNITIRRIGGELESTANTTMWGNVGLNGSTWSTENTVRYFPINGQTNNAPLTESLVQVEMRGAQTATHVRTTVQSNARTTSTTLAFRQNGANAASVSIGSGATGRFSDTTTSVSIAEGDLVNYALTLAAGDNANIVIPLISASPSITATTTNRVKFNGVAKPMKVYVGGAWTTKPVKRYSAGAWA